MSLDPRLGHLYHDSTASIDAREQLRIREINAREKRHLAQQTYVLDRARDICERSRKWEHDKVKRQMKKIKDRTMSLEMSLKQEAKRVAAFEQGENIVTSAPSLVSRTSVFAEVPREVKSAPDAMSSVRTVSKSNGFKRRSSHVVRSLLKMYNRCDQRRRLSEELSFKLDRAQIDTLQKAKIVLRGTEAEEEVSRILDRNNGGFRTIRAEGVSGYKSLWNNATPKANNKVHGSREGQPVVGDKGVSSNTADTPITWTRFNKLPALWRQEYTTLDVSNTKLVSSGMKCRNIKSVVS